jgi:hypothetical protein
MTAISRYNTTNSNQNMIAKIIAVCLMVAGGIMSIVALNQSGNLVLPTYETRQPSTATVEKQATQAQTLPQISIALESAATPRIALQDQQPNVIARLQPTQNTVQYTQVTVTTLQPSANNIQLTGSNLQNAQVVLQ